MTNTYDDNNIYGKAFRLPKYLQKCVVYVCPYACMHIHTRFVQRILLEFKCARKEFSS